MSIFLRDPPNPSSPDPEPEQRAPEEVEQPAVGRQVWVTISRSYFMTHTWSMSVREKQDAWSRWWDSVAENRRFAENAETYIWARLDPRYTTETSETTD